MITGIDYLTGEDSIPINELRVVTKDETPDTPLFPEVSESFAYFAATFTRKYGEMNGRGCPVVLTPESLAIIRSYYEAADGRINRVSDNKAAKAW